MGYSWIDRILGYINGDLKWSGELDLINSPFCPHFLYDNCRLVKECQCDNKVRSKPIWIRRPLIYDVYGNRYPEGNDILHDCDGKPYRIKLNN